jgi:hypothetical protein
MRRLIAVTALCVTLTGAGLAACSPGSQSKSDGQRATARSQSTFVPRTTLTVPEVRATMRALMMHEAATAVASETALAG